MFMIIALDVILIMHFPINCSAVTCSPTIIYAISREATSETYGPKSLFHYIESRLHLAKFLIYYFAIFTFQSINQKYQKYSLYCLSISIRSHILSDPEGIDNPFIALVASS